MPCYGKRVVEVCPVTTVVMVDLSSAASVAAVSSCCVSLALCMTNAPARPYFSLSTLYKNPSPLPPPRLLRRLLSSSRLC